MPEVNILYLFQCMSSKTLREIEKCLNDKIIDINTVVYYNNTNSYTDYKNSILKTTLLEVAVRRGDLNIVNCLLKNGADVNKSGQNNTTSLSRAVMEDKLAIVKLLISKGADVNSIHPNDGNTPLAISVLSRKKEIAKYLISVGANICKVGKNGKTPLLWAVENNDLEIITEILDNAADAKHIIHTPFMRAIELQHFEIFQLLRKRGALINFIYKNGYTPLTMALELYNFEIVQELIQNGADVNMTDSDRDYPLIQTIQMRNFELMKNIIEAGANLDVISKSGNTPLILAIQKENFEMVKYLVEKGADVNKASDQNSAPLLFAAANYNIPIFEFLIKCGADLLNNVIEEIGECTSDNEDFFIYFNLLKENVKKVPVDIKSTLFTGHEETSS